MSFGFLALILLVLPLSIEALPHDLTSLADASALKERRADQIIILCLIFSLLVYCIIFPVLAIIIGHRGKLPSGPSNRRVPPKISGSVPSQISAPELPQYVGAAAPLPPAAPEVTVSQLPWSASHPSCCIHARTPRSPRFYPFARRSRMQSIQQASIRSRFPKTSPSPGRTPRQSW
ncbi:hypothetical protein DFH08DRAFT_928011 [Mycena albidolilacea]|uniref:Uncharacterized protein n=1 Tax=Mycena albidolilacea TaxID=1033008 RepID=A0AAD7AT04_9AGAR|nr:hypothetical protein DFH08DRAFT_928011 [Mycena albidolilacea]